MSKRKKKNAVTLISLLLVTAALIIFYIWYSGREQSSDNNSSAGSGKKTGDTQTATLELATMDTTQVNAIHFTNKDADMELVYNNSVWKSDPEPNRPINQDNVNKMLSLIATVKATRLVTEKPEDLAEYGLAEPSAFFVAIQKDGKTLSIRIGDPSVGGDGYYAQVNGKEAVYLVDSSYGTGFAYTDLAMTAVEKAPSITAENIYHINVDKKDGEDFELLYDKENSIDDTNSGLFPWVILKPFEEGYPADGSKVSDTLPNYASFNFLSCVDYSGENLAKYGLGAPSASITVEYYQTRTEKLDTPETDPNTGEQITEKTYNDPKSFQIYVGNSDGAENYYVRKEGSNAVYTMKAEEVDKMLSTDPFSVMSSFISIPNIESVEKIEAEIEGKAYTMEIKREPAKNDSGEEETKATYYYNGKPTDEDIFKDVYQVMVGAGYDAQVKETVDVSKLTPYMTITYHLTGGTTMTTSYYPHDESFYLVANQKDPVRFFSDKREIDEIAQAIKEFKRLETE